MNRVPLLLATLWSISNLSFAATSDEPSGHPLEVYNGSGDGNYAAGEIVTITGNPPSGSNAGMSTASAGATASAAADQPNDWVFIRWIKKEGNGRIGNPSDESTTLTMSGKKTVVVAVYGKINAWFPPGKETAKKGLLLPKNPQAQEQFRLEHRTRVTISMEEGSDVLPPAKVWEQISVSLGWFPSQECEGIWHSGELVKYWDSSSQGTEIRKDSSVPKSQFEEKSPGVYEASVWYEGNWTMDQLPSKVDADKNQIMPKTLTGFGLVIHAVNYANTRQGTHEMLVPVDMAVDTNRDGVIKFAGNFNDQSVAGKPSDMTTEDKPFRFWLNNDRDVPNQSFPDSQHPVIPNIRDMEDYARLHIHIDAFKEQFEDGTFQVGLEWRNTGGTNPSIKLAMSGEPDGGTAYLTDVGAAKLQPKLLMEVKTGVSAKLPLSQYIWTQGNGHEGTPSSFPTGYFLLSGVKEGKGELVLTIWKENQKIGEGGSVWIELVDVRVMYVRAKGTPETNIDEPWNDKPSLKTGFVSDPNGHDFVKPRDEEKKVLIYVHGIHAPLAGQNASYLGNIDVAETAYKRLWHAGYKGRFAFYKWPALNPVGFFTSGTGFEFNQSEYRAWKYGKGLSAFAASMPVDYQRNVLAHSQGNAVVAAAFRDYNLAASAWVVTQGAIPISCYDDDSGHLVFPFTTPDLASDLGYRGYLKNQVPAKVVNFFNLDDSVTGQVWEANQSLCKPTMELSGITRIEYKYFAGSGEVRLEKLFNNVLLSDRSVVDVHESMAMVVKSRSRSIGHGSAAGGEVNNLVDLDAEFSFGDEHGSQWDRAIQQNVMLYFQRLLDEIE